MHTMQDQSEESHEPPLNNGYLDGNAYTSTRVRPSETKRPQFRDTMLAVVGMLLPLLAQLGHAH